MDSDDYISQKVAKALYFLNEKEKEENRIDDNQSEAQDASILLPAGIRMKDKPAPQERNKYVGRPVKQHLTS